MTKGKVSGRSLTRSAEPLYREIRAVLESARTGAYRAVNATMVRAYWHVGRLIVEYEQKGLRRAGYGDAVIATLAKRLTMDLGRGFDERNLWYMRSFHLAFPILNAPRSELRDSGKLNAARSESPALRPGFPGPTRTSARWNPTCACSTPMRDPRATTRRSA
jgi:hypothetical protein